MSLRLKLLSGFLILTVMLFVAGVMSIYELTAMGTSVQKLLDDNYKSITASKMMIEALEREDSGILLLLSGKWEEGRKTLEDADRVFAEGFEIAKHNITIAGEQNYVEAIEAGYKHYKDLWIRPIVGTEREGNLNWYFQDVHKAFQNVKYTVQKLADLNDKAMYQTASGLKARAHRAIMPGIIAILSAFVFTLIFNFFIQYYIVGPIRKITEEIKSAAMTGKDPQVKIETRDELFRLWTSIQELIVHLRHDRTKE
jgi:methyl-accepting chemotaxis protein